jgi:serine/threonine-protein kinase RsbW/stage II sporulation protein AB (anti-sigma F factor)
MSPPVLVRRFTARPERIAAIRHEVRDCAEANGASDPNAVALAVTEAITNAVVHAYVDRDEPGDIEVIVQRLPDAGLEILVCDEGRGMMPRPDSPGIGLGLPMVATLAERFEIQARADGGTRVLMAFATG